MTHLKFGDYWISERGVYQTSHGYHGSVDYEYVVMFDDNERVDLNKIKKLLDFAFDQGQNSKALEITSALDVSYRNFYNR